MRYKEVLKECRNLVVNNAITEEIDRLVQQCGNQLCIDVSERALAGRLADYFRPNFEGLDVEIEYNRMGNSPKKLAWKENPERVFPDIIVHEPMTIDRNLLVIELKKSSNIFDQIIRLMAPYDKVDATT